MSIRYRIHYEQVSIYLNMSSVIQHVQFHTIICMFPFIFEFGNNLCNVMSFSDGINYHRSHFSVPFLGASGKQGNWCDVRAAVARAVLRVPHRVSPDRSTSHWPGEAVGLYDF